MRVCLGADHRGYALKERLKVRLAEEGFTIEDKGAFAEDPGDDYPDFALPVARAVAANPEARGILLCGSGMGMDVVANKVRGVRATVGYSLESVVHARSHDDINVITLAADILSEEEAARFAGAFLSTAFDEAERNVRRLEKIARVEEAENLGPAPA